MSKNEITLKSLKPKQIGIVAELRAEHGMRRRLMDIGIIEGTKIKCLHVSPAGDPVAYQIRGAVIALRLEEASKILLKI